MFAIRVIITCWAVSPVPNGQIQAVEALILFVLLWISPRGEQLKRW